MLSNSVENGFNDDIEPRDGFGGGLYNGGNSATVLFKRTAIFQDNVGGFVSAPQTECLLSGTPSVGPQESLMQHLPVVPFAGH